MTTMTGFDMHDVDLLDEDFLGPPPRFLVEEKADDFHDGEPGLIEADDDSALGRLKSFIDNWVA